jgi:uncharacterized membrane protein YuzA (DUF378 family)
MSKFEDNPLWVVGIWIVLSVAAINWGLVAQFDLNLVTEIFGESDYIVFLVIGGLGLVDLLETFGVLDIYD